MLSFSFFSLLSTIGDYVCLSWIDPNTPALTSLLLHWFLFFVCFPVITVQSAPWVSFLFFYLLFCCFLFGGRASPFPSIESWQMQSSPVASIITKTVLPSTLPSSTQTTPPPRSCPTFTASASASSAFSHSPPPTSACGFSRSSPHSRGAVTPLWWPPLGLLHCHLHLLHHLLHHLPHRRFHYSPAAPSPSSPSPRPPARSCCWETCPCCSPSSTSFYGSGTRSWPVALSAPGRATLQCVVSGSGRG